MEAKVVITPTAGKEVSTPTKDFYDNEILLGIGIQAYLNDNFALDMRVEASDSNLMADGGRTDLERGSANLLYDFTPKNIISPYIFGGAGYEKLHRTYLNIKSQPFYQLGAGLKFNVHENLEFITEAKYIRKKDTKVDEVIATCGLGVKFGNDECEISCEKLNNIKSNTINKKEEDEPKSAVKSLKDLAVKNDKIPIFSDEDKIVASKYPLKKEKNKSSFIKGNYIQVGAFKEGKNLKNTLYRLKNKGLKVKTIKKGKTTVVLVGPYSKKLIGKVYKRVKIAHKDAFYKKL
jgi:cell division septation protein DedD